MDGTEARTMTRRGLRKESSSAWGSTKVTQTGREGKGFTRVLAKAWCQRKFSRKGTPFARAIRVLMWTMPVTNTPNATQGLFLKVARRCCCSLRGPRRPRDVRAPHVPPVATEIASDRCANDYGKSKIKFFMDLSESQRDNQSLALIESTAMSAASVRHLSPLGPLFRSFVRHSCLQQPRPRTRPTKHHLWIEFETARSPPAFPQVTPTTARARRSLHLLRGRSGSAKGTYRMAGQ